MSECNWIYDEACERWLTSCNHAFVLNCGTPKDNDMKFCPYCGKPLVENKENEDA